MRALPTLSSGRPAGLGTSHSLFYNGHNLITSTSISYVSTDMHARYPIKRWELWRTCNGVCHGCLQVSENHRGGLKGMQFESIGMTNDRGCLASTAFDLRIGIGF